jgi:hypothetical protein
MGDQVKALVRKIVFPTVGDPDPDPQDPHVSGHPESGSISHKYGSGYGHYPFLIKWTEIMQNKILTQNFQILAKM